MPGDTSLNPARSRVAHDGPADAILRTESLSVRYGGTRALVDVDLAVTRGRLVALIGPNGAGKTTFLDAVTGFARTTGRVWLDGRDISAAQPHERARRGLARTFQAGELFVDLTVRENLNVAAPRGSGWRELRPRSGPRSDAHDRVDETLALLGVDGLVDAMPDELTIGQLKLVGVARALVSRPQVLCLDEPAAGLTTTESRELGQRLRRIVDTGTTVLLVDHDMGLVLSVSDHVVVLNFGEVIASGAPAAVRDDPAVIEAYLGSSGLTLDTPVGAR